MKWKIPSKLTNEIDVIHQHEVEIKMRWKCGSRNAGNAFKNDMLFSKNILIAAI